MLLSAVVHADCVRNTCTQVYVQSIYTESPADSWIQTTGTETNLVGCVPDSGLFLWLNGTASQKKVLA